MNNMTLDEFFEKTEARRLLVENLEVNTRIYVPDHLVQKELMRVNLIVIRQAMEDEGVE